jgi:hypothetical protein
MKIPSTTILGVAMSLGLLAVSAAGSNLVTNGDFEGTTTIGPNGDIVESGWVLLPTDVVSASNFDIESSDPFPDPDGGTHYAAFMSSEADGSQDCLDTTFPTVTGQKYTVSFWVAITAASGSNTTLLPQWDWNGTAQVDMRNNFYCVGPSPTACSAPTNTGPVAYQQFTFTETASSNSTQLIFHGTDSTGAILLDDVVVTAVTPVPETTSLLLMGSGLLIVGLRRRAKK